MMRTMVTRETKISLPAVTPEIYDNYVTYGSPKKIREAVRKIAVYFRREGGYDFTQYDVEDKTKHETYVFHRPTVSRRSCQWGSEIFGAVCFRWRDDWEDVSSRWCLQWVWLHPYFRHKGYLQEVWPQFLERYGRDFFPETPYSGAMIGFLRKNITKEQLKVFEGLGWTDFVEKHFSKQLA